MDYSFANRIWKNGPYPSYTGEYLYNCTINRSTELPEWVELDIDLDHDGYTTSQDCQDNPTADPPQCQDLELPQDCAQDPIKYSNCAICINPGAPEVCGDTVNNDCGGPGKHESVEELNGATSNDCNKNQFACTQTAPGETASTPPATPPAEATPPSAQATGTGVTQKNIYDKGFSWISTQEGGYCCGYNGIVDLGESITTADGSGNYLCLNKNKELIGYDEESALGGELCAGEWCWVKK